MEDHLHRAALITFASEIRVSSVKRFRLVRPEHYAWRPQPDLLSFVDVLKHLVDADHWLFNLLDAEPTLPDRSLPRGPQCVISPGDAQAQAWDKLFEEFIQLGAERCRRIGAFTERDFSQRQFDLGERGLLSLAHLILRCNLDHEIHHRGALQLSLRLLYG